MKQSLTTSQQQIAIVKQKRLALAKSMISNRPMLAKIAENKKIRDYLPAEIKQAQENILNYLMVLMGVSVKNDEQMKHVGMVGVFILEEYNNYAYEEIKQAFKLAIKGTYEGFELIYKLDCQVLTKVMNQYENYKREQLRVYNSKLTVNLLKIQENANKPTLEQNEIACITGIKSCFNHYKKNGRIELGSIYLYDWLFKKGLMPKDKPTVNAIKKEAKKRFEKRKDLALNRKEAMMYNVFENGKETIRFSNLCREISLEEYFNKYKNEDQMLNSIKNK